MPADQPAASRRSETQRMNYRVHAALLLVAILFSLNYIISKLAMNAFHPLTFAYLRVVGTALVLNLILPHDRVAIDRSGRRAIAGFALVGVVLNQVLFLAGLSMTNAHVAAIVMTLIPVFTLAVALVLGRESATAMKVGGIAIAAAGALLVVGGEGIQGTRRELIGALLLLGNCFSYAVYLVVSKPMMSRLSARRVIGKMFLNAALFMTPLAVIPLWREHWSAIPPSAWLALALVIAGPTVAAYVLNAWALARSDSSLVAAYTYLQPILTAAMAAAFLQERIRGIVVIAAVMIFAGVAVSGRPAPPASREEAVPGNPD